VESVRHPQFNTEFLKHRDLGDHSPDLREYDSPLRSPNIGLFEALSPARLYHQLHSLAANFKQLLITVEIFTYS
jgi:hypothetical protein